MRCSKKTYVSIKCFYTGEITAFFFSLVVHEHLSSEVYIQLEVTGVSVMGAGQWRFSKGTACLFPEMTFAVCLYSFSCSIFGPPVTHSIKRGQQISEISFSLTQRNQFRFQVILLSVHLWQLARSQGESTFISVLSVRTSSVPLSILRVQLTSSVRFIPHSFLVK